MSKIVGNLLKSIHSVLRLFAKQIVIWRANPRVSMWEDTFVQDMQFMACAFVNFANISYVGVEAKILAYMVESIVKKSCPNNYSVMLTS